MDHDQRFKNLIKEFFAEFLALFFQDWSELIDTSVIEWLDKELIFNAPEGERHMLDLVAKTRVREPVDRVDGSTPNENCLVVVHIEIESGESLTSIHKRMPSYYRHLTEYTGLAVLPIVIYLKMHLNDVREMSIEEKFGKMCVNRFTYLCVPLAGMNGIKYIQGSNPLGVALSALMKLPQDRIVELGSEALKRIAGAELNEQKKFYLAECFQAYLPLTKAESEALDQFLHTTTDRGLKAMNLTTYDRGILKGREEGLLMGITLALEAKFGSEGVLLGEQIRTSTLDWETLNRIAQAIRSAKTIQDVQKIPPWLVLAAFPTKPAMLP